MTCRDTYNIPQNGAVRIHKDYRFRNRPCFYGQVLFSDEFCLPDVLWITSNCVISLQTHRETLHSVLSATTTRRLKICLARTPDVTSNGKNWVKCLAKRCTFGCCRCTHPVCDHSMVSNQWGVGCSSCNNPLVLDPGQSGPKWRFCCNACGICVPLCEGAEKLSLSNEDCENCGARLINVSYKGRYILLRLFFHEPLT